MEINSFFNKINEETEMSAQSLLDQRLKLNPEELKQKEFGTVSNYLELLESFENEKTSKKSF